MKERKKVVSPFDNPEEGNLFKLKSDYDFYEFFVDSKIKCNNIFIPDTVLFSEGSISAWIFTNAKERAGPQILQKGKEKLTYGEVLVKICGVPPESRDEVMTNTKLSQNINFSVDGGKEFLPIAYIKLVNKQKILVNRSDLCRYITENGKQISYFQKKKNIAIKSDYFSNEIFFCEYKQDPKTNMFCCKTYKRFSKFTNPKDNSSSFSYIPRDYRHMFETCGEITRNLEAKDFSPVYISWDDSKKERSSLLERPAQSFFIKSVDLNTNANLEKLTKNIFDILAVSKYYYVKKIICKYVFDGQNFLFLGISDFFVDFKSDYEWLRPKLNPEVPFFLEDLLKIIDKFDKTPPPLEKKQPAAPASTNKNNKVPSNFTRTLYSPALMSKLIEEKCLGGFCEFIALKQYKGGLEEEPFQRFQNAQQKENFLKTREFLKEFTHNKLPCQISNTLIQKTSMYKNEVKELLKSQQIIPKSLFSLHKDKYDDVDFDIDFKKFSSLNKKRNYNFVKICSNCYHIYTLVQKKLEIMEDERMDLSETKKKDKWIHTQAKFLSSWNSSLQLQNKPDKDFFLPDVSKKAKAKDARAKEKTLSRIEEPHSARLGMNSPQTLDIPKGFQRKKSCATSIQSNQIINQDMNTLLLRIGQRTSLKQQGNSLMEDSDDGPMPSASLMQISSSYWKKGEGNQSQNQAMGKSSIFSSLRTGNMEFPSLKNPNNKLNLYLMIIRTPRGNFPLESKKDKTQVNFQRHRQTLMNKPTTSTDIIKSLNFLMSNSGQLDVKAKITHVSAKGARSSILMKKRLSLLPAYVMKTMLHKQKNFNENDFGSRCIPLVHRIFTHLRSFPSFRLSAPKLSTIDAINPFVTERDQPNLKFEDVCKLLEVPVPDVGGEISVLIVDESTAIPFMVLKSRETEEMISREIIIIMNDFFDNFMDKIEVYQKILRNMNDVKIVLFNYPGQSYTLFSEEKTYTSDKIAELLDLLIYDLQQKGEFYVRSDTFKFVGFGYGAYALLHFLCFNDGIIANLKSALLFNPFMYIDDTLKDSLEKTIKVFGELRDYAPCEIFYHSMTCIQRKESQADSPLGTSEDDGLEKISTKGRISLLKGCLYSPNISQNLQQLKTSLLVFFSNNNSFFSPNQTDMFMKMVKSTQIHRHTNGSPDLPLFQVCSADFNKYLFLNYDGGFDFLKDQTKLCREKILDYINIKYPLTTNQRIAFVDKETNLIERKMVEMFLLYIEKSIEFIKNPLERILNCTNYQINTYIRTYKSKYEKIKKEFKTIEKLMTITFREYKFSKDNLTKVDEYDDLHERNEKTLHLQYKKINDIRTNFFKIQKDFMFPLRKIITAMKFWRKHLTLNNTNLRELRHNRQLFKEAFSAESLRPFFSEESGLEAKSSARESMFESKKSLSTSVLVLIDIMMRMKLNYKDAFESIFGYDMSEMKKKADSNFKDLEKEINETLDETHDIFEGVAKTMSENKTFSDEFCVPFSLVLVEEKKLYLKIKTCFETVTLSSMKRQSLLASMTDLEGKMKKFQERSSALDEQINDGSLSDKSISSLDFDLYKTDSSDEDMEEEEDLNGEGGESENEKEFQSTANFKTSQSLPYDQRAPPVKPPHILRRRSSIKTDNEINNRLERMISTNYHVGKKAHGEGPHQLSHDNLCDRVLTEIGLDIRKRVTKLFELEKKLGIGS